MAVKEDVGFWSQIWDIPDKTFYILLILSISLFGLKNFKVLLKKKKAKMGHNNVDLKHSERLHSGLT